MGLGAVEAPPVACDCPKYGIQVLTMVSLKRGEGHDFMQGKLRF